MCLYPTLITNRKYIPNKKNGGIVPPLPLLYDPETDRIIEDKRVLLVPVGCGKCIECMKQKSREWSVRLQEEVRSNQNGIFVTLTFNNKAIRYIGLNKIDKRIKGYDRDNAIATYAVRHFLERWRKKYKKSLRHWLVTELGHQGTENIHMHGIIWNNTKMNKEQFRNEIERIWKSGEDTGGYIFPTKKELKDNYLSNKVVNYIVKYIHKMDEDHKEYKPKVLTSAGIGKQYTERVDKYRNRYKGNETNEKYKAQTGVEIPLPIYMRNKIYTEEEREQLWLDKLDKGERYVLGEKAIDEEHYYRMLEEARNKNKKLGYGDNEINWNRRNYENEQRNLKFIERIKSR